MCRLDFKPGLEIENTTFSKRRLSYFISERISDFNYV